MNSFCFVFKWNKFHSNLTILIIKFTFKRNLNFIKKNKNFNLFTRL